MTTDAPPGAAIRRLLDIQRAAFVAEGPSVEGAAQRPVPLQMAINDVPTHAALLDAPFGGVGASGMGRYDGREASSNSATSARSTMPVATTPAASGAWYRRMSRT